MTKKEVANKKSGKNNMPPRLTLNTVLAIGLVASLYSTTCERIFYNISVFLMSLFSGISEKMRKSSSPCLEAREPQCRLQPEEL